MGGGLYITHEMGSFGHTRSLTSISSPADSCIFTSLLVSLRRPTTIRSLTNSPHTNHCRAGVST
jgi:hypothetical protein